MDEIIPGLWVGNIYAATDADALRELVQARAVASAIAGQFSPRALSDVVRDGFDDEL